jgi:hypothetical protein
MIQLLIFNYKCGDEYAFIPLAVPVDVLELRSITQILPHASAVISVMSRRQSFATFSATSLEHEASVLAGHASAEAMRLCASSIVWLKSALRHRNEFSL